MLCRGSVPAYMWGVMSTASMLEDFRSDGEDVDQIVGIWAFPGETAEERDGRMIEDMHGDLMRSATLGEVFSDNLLRKFFNLRPAYFAVKPRRNLPPSKYMRMKPVHRPSAAPCDFDALVAGRDKLNAHLHLVYGEQAHIATVDNAKYERFGVFLRRDGLTVMVTLTDKEAERRHGLVHEMSYSHFVSLVPTEIDGITVQVGQWHLDKTATAGLE